MYLSLLIVVALLAWTGSADYPLVGVVPEGTNLVIRCDGASISGIVFTRYGDVTGCVAPNSKSKIEALCVGRAECTVFAGETTFGTDPCPGKPKKLFVQATCSERKQQQPPMQSSLTFNGLVQLVNASGLALPQADLEQLFDDCDKDHDSVISGPELTELIERLKKRTPPAPTTVAAKPDEYRQLLRRLEDEYEEGMKQMGIDLPVVVDSSSGANPGHNATSPATPTPSSSPSHQVKNTTIMSLPAVASPPSNGTKLHVLHLDGVTHQTNASSSVRTLPAFRGSDVVVAMNATEAITELDKLISALTSISHDAKTVFKDGAVPIGATDDIQGVVPPSNQTIPLTVTGKSNSTSEPRPLGLQLSFKVLHNASSASSLNGLESDPFVTSFDSVGTRTRNDTAPINTTEPPAPTTAPSDKLQMRTSDPWTTRTVVYIPNGQERQLMCSGNITDVRFATYWWAEGKEADKLVNTPECQAEQKTALATVTDMCMNKSGCRLTLPEGEHADVCPSSSKYVTVAFKCTVHPPKVAM